MDVIHSLDSGADFEGEAGYSLFMIGGRFRAQGVVVGVLASLLAITGCTGSSQDPTPTPTTTISSSSTPTPSVTATPPAAPEAVRSAKGAEEFVRYFWDVYNYSYATRDSSLLLDISQSECEFCSSTADEIADFVAHSTEREGGTITVDDVSAPPVKSPKRILVVSAISQSAGKTITSTGITTPIPALQKVGGSVGLEWTQNTWQVHGVSIETSS